MIDQREEMAQYWDNEHRRQARLLARKDATDVAAPEGPYRCRRCLRLWPTTLTTVNVSAADGRAFAGDVCDVCAETLAAEFP